MTASDSAELRTEATYPAISPHAVHTTNRLTWLRARVLGANDGIVSAVGVALVLTETVSAILGGARKRRAVMRVVLGRPVAMLVSDGFGQMVGTTT